MVLYEAFPLWLPGMSAGCGTINSGNNTNFWRYALLQQGLWAAYSVAIFECCFNAALPLHSMPGLLLVESLSSSTSRPI